MRSGPRPPRVGPACSATPRRCGGSPRSSPTSTACDRSRPSRFASRRGTIWIPSATGGSRSSRRLDEAYRPVARIGSSRAWPRGRRRRRPGPAGRATRSPERDDGARARERRGCRGRRVAPGPSRLTLRDGDDRWHHQLPTARDAPRHGRADAPFWFTFDAVLRDLYGSHPYGRHYLGRTESIERLTRDELRAHYRAIYRPERMVLAVSGQVERGRVIKVAERLFGRMARS